jgi:hypothetical protein
MRQSWTDKYPACSSEVTCSNLTARFAQGSRAGLAARHRTDDSARAIQDGTEMVFSRSAYVDISLSL